MAVSIYFSYIILFVILSFVNLWRLFDRFLRALGKRFPKMTSGCSIIVKRTCTRCIVCTIQSAGAWYLARRVLCTNKLNAFHRRPPPLNASSPLDVRFAERTHLYGPHCVEPAGESQVAYPSNKNLEGSHFQV